MKLVFITGNSAVGKMTVGQELMQLTGLRLFHNHVAIEPVLEVFGEFDQRVISRVRRVFFEEFAASQNYGMIFTYMWAFDQPSDWAYIEEVKGIWRLLRPDYWKLTEGTGVPAGKERSLLRIISKSITLFLKQGKQRGAFKNIFLCEICFCRAFCPERKMLSSAMDGGSIFIQWRNSQYEAGNFGSQLWHQL